MVPTSYSKLTISTTATISAVHNQTKINHTTGTFSNLFGAYQILTVGISNRMIRVPVPLPFSQPPYRKVMVADIFFRAIKGLAVDSSFSSADIVATITAYSDFNTIFAELETTQIADIIRSIVFGIDNLIGMGVYDRHGTAITFEVNDAHPTILYYFAFHSILWVSDLDDYARTD